MDLGIRVTCRSMGNLGSNLPARLFALVPKDWYFLPMHRVAFVVYPGFELLDMSGPVAVFDGANHVLAQAGKQRECTLMPLAGRSSREGPRLFQKPK
jgi:hypothetical protein